ncbi:MAG: hypothetical protein FJ100_21385 [Deltaproteobacteria bacterium]|nr:hypothetical protein [Deltaproteobacteria bacterium]
MVPRSSLRGVLAVLTAAALPGCPQAVPPADSFATASAAGDGSATGVHAGDAGTASADAPVQSDGADVDAPLGAPDTDDSDVGTPGDAAITDVAGPGDAKPDGPAKDGGPVPCATAADCGPAPGPCQGWQCVTFCYPLLQNAVACDDGNACTTGDVCLAGACQAGKTTACDDGNACTDDSCLPAKGCAFKPKVEGAACGPAKQCSKGVCTGGIAAGVSHIAAATYLSCAIASAGGQVLCWGDDEVGQVGAGSKDGKWFTTPQVVGGLAGATQVDCGEFHCCASTAKGLFCWGDNQFAQVTGDGVAGKSQPSPVQVLVPAVQLAIGQYHSCARDTGGTVSCWGLGSSGQLGSGGNPVGQAAAPVQLAQKAKDVDCGRTFCCAVHNDDTVACWGINAAGQMGIGMTGPGSEKVVPVLAKGVTGAKQVAAGGEHVCVLLETGGVMCWGAAGYGQTGVPGPSVQASPTKIGNLVGVTHLAAGGDHTCALAGGKLLCWGDNHKLQAVPASKSVMVTAPVEVQGLADVVQLALGGQHTLARTAAGKLFAWGGNNLGQLGDGTTKDAKAILLVQ